MYTDEDVLLGTRGLSKILNGGIDAGEPATYGNIVEVIKPDQLRYVVAKFAGYGLLDPRSSGETFTIDRNVQRYKKAYDIQQYSIMIEHDPIVDKFDIYGFVKQEGPNLKGAAVATLNKLAANAFLNGATTLVTPDGIALFGTHTRLSGATFVNSGTGNLSVANLQSAIAVVLSDVGERGIPRHFTDGLVLHHSPLKAADAIEIVSSIGLADTAERRDNKYIPKNIVKLNQEVWLNDTVVSGCSDQWYLTPASSAKNPIKFIEFAPITAVGDNVVQRSVVQMGINMAYTLVALDDEGCYASIPA